MTEKPSPCRLAVDIGGTFTDAVLEKDGAHIGGKVLTTAANPAEGFMTAAQQILAAADLAPGDLDLIIHGTTLATNALIERKGAKTALIVTEGHRDSLEMAYENRFDQYDLDADRPAPLVPRQLRWPLRERVTWRGEVLEPLDEANVAALLPEIEAQGIESLAIGLIHSYANPAHERRIAEIHPGGLSGPFHLPLLGSLPRGAGVRPPVHHLCQRLRAPHDGALPDRSAGPLEAQPVLPAPASS